MQYSEFAPLQAITNLCIIIWDLWAGFRSLSWLFLPVRIQWRSKVYRIRHITGDKWTEDRPIYRCTGGYQTRTVSTVWCWWTVDFIGLLAEGVDVFLNWFRTRKKALWPVAITTVNWSCLSYCYFNVIFRPRKSKKDAPSGENAFVLCMEDITPRAMPSPHPTQVSPGFLPLSFTDSWLK